MKYYTCTLTLPNGKRKFYRGRTKKEAEEKRAKDRVALGQGIMVGDRTTFAEAAELWYGLFKEDKVHIRSAETIRHTLDRYILPVLGGMAVADIRPLHIQALMHNVNKYSHSTQSKVLQYTKAVLRMAVDNKLITSSPCTSDIKAAGEQPAEVVPLSDSQVKTLLTATEDTRVHPFLMVLLYAGLRKGEALGLMWSDIDFDADTITVNRSIVFPESNRAGEINPHCKTESAHRTIPMVPELKSELLNEYHKTKSLYVFSTRDGRHLSESSFRKMWDLIKYRSTSTLTASSKVDRTIDFDVHPHQLRHTFATNLIRAGFDPKTVQYLMGHATVDMTMRIYSHYVDEQRREQTAEKMREALAM